MTSNKDKSGFFIGVTCPGCGSRLEMESDFFVLTCDSCGSVLRIKMPEIPPAYIIENGKSRREARSYADRYLKKASLPLTESGVEIKMIYQPYWKVDAVLLKVRNRVEERHIYYAQEAGAEQDVTYEKKLTDINLSAYSMTHSAGPEDDEIPHSIGLRASYVRMEPYSQDNIPDDFVCQPVVRPWEKVIGNVEQGTARLNEINPAAFGKNKTRLFHPTASIVYFPYFIVESKSTKGLRRLIVDGVSGSVASFVDRCQPLELKSDEFSIHMEFGHLGVEFHRCPNCGFDLPGKQSYAYICDNCQQFIMLETNPFMNNEIHTVVGSDNQNDKLIPFWSMKLPAGDVGVVKMMFGGIYDSDRLILPAIRTSNFESIFKLCQRMSSAAPKMDTVPVDSFDSQFEPVSMSLSEALVMAEVIIYRAKAGRTNGENSEPEQFSPVEISLIYAPFHLESYFYIDSVIGAVTFEKNLIS
ncbi:MAG: hypothetical protein GY865_08595 [candidate division Zixibacteria bacterium]|nr:hypothetical protein [candidate division Zixibacteria bacterium]